MCGIGVTEHDDAVGDGPETAPLSTRQLGSELSDEEREKEWTRTVEFFPCVLTVCPSPRGDCGLALRWLTCEPLGALTVWCTRQARTLYQAGSATRRSTVVSTAYL